MNTYGSYLCLCKEGYVNQNGSCLRPTTDFCALQHDQFCDPRAKCVNLVDKAACLCLDGYKGDGTYCVGMLALSTTLPLCSFTTPPPLSLLSNAFLDMAHLPLLDKMEIISDEFTTSNLRLLNVINSNGPIQKLAGNLIRNVTVDIMSKESMWQGMVKVKIAKRREGERSVLTFQLISSLSPKSKMKTVSEPI